MKISRIAIGVAFFVLASCAAKYTLVPSGSALVAKKSMQLETNIEWNKIPKGSYDIKYEENWTANGPLLDSISFIGGLPGGKAITKQRKKDDKKVPVFEADMTPQDLVSMIETYYSVRMNATLFEVVNVGPVEFLNTRGIQIDCAYVGQNQLRRRCRVVMATLDGNLYLMSLDAAALHYFDAALPEFESMARAASAL